ncbi:hypothetical protein MLD38_039488 [Melastoma candidum]|uniref:Uncharacterized protein n=1 Tax=Melastoma candidum TaxID=119954 RepID=A0ACB9L3Q0_9MYRT|nr:hypothetical protein MLD38_039488 [Melastoma candidum]
MRFLAGTLRSAAAYAFRSTRVASPRSILIQTNRISSSFGALSSYSFSSFPNQSVALSAPSPGAFDRLTDRRFPKRRPSDKPRRKRASLRPPGPYAWVPYVPGQPILPNNPNEGSVKGRNEKKRRRLRRAFKLAEAKKRKVQMQEARRKKLNARVERKMAAVARERAWAQRLAELLQLEEEKKKKKKKKNTMAL